VHTTISDRKISKSNLLAIFTLKLIPFLIKAVSQRMKESGFTCLPWRMNEKILHIIDQKMYVVIHIPKGIYHVVPFSITQARGIKESFHFPNVRLFDVGCAR
jgi:hypothetical protein